MFFELSSHQVHGKINVDSYRNNFFTSDKLSQKINTQIVVNKKIQEALEKVWKTQHILEIKPEYLGNYSISKKSNKGRIYLIKSDKKIFAIDSHSKKESHKHYKQEKEEDKEESFKFFIEAVLDNLCKIHPEIIQISKKAKQLLLFCGKKWHKNRTRSFKVIIETLKNYEKEESKEV